MSHDLSRDGSPPLSAKVLSRDLSCDRAARVLSRIPGTYTVPGTHQLSPPPRLACVCGGRDHSPNTQANWGVGGRLYSNPHHAGLFSNALSQISLSSMGPTTCTSPCAVSMKVECLQGAPPHLHTQTSYAGTRALIRRWTRIALYNRLFARSIVTRCRGVGFILIPWGRGLKG